MSYLAPEAAVIKTAVRPSSGTVTARHSSNISQTTLPKAYHTAFPSSQPSGENTFLPLDCSHPSEFLSTTFISDQPTFSGGGCGIEGDCGDGYSLQGDYSTIGNHQYTSSSGSYSLNPIDTMVHYTPCQSFAAATPDYSPTNARPYPDPGLLNYPVTAEGLLLNGCYNRNYADSTDALFAGSNRHFSMSETAAVGRCAKLPDSVDSVDSSSDPAGINSSYEFDSGSTSPRDNRKPPEQTARQRHQANQRERKRMKSLNKAFESLRTKIPTFPYEKRLSKVDTLRMAIRYIQYLNDLVIGGDERGNGTGSLRSRGHNGSKSLSLRKVVINCPTGTRFEEDMLGFSPIRGLALSWTRGDDDCPASNLANSTLSAKIWMPETQQNDRIADADKTDHH